MFSFVYHFTTLYLTYTNFGLNAMLFMAIDINIMLLIVYWWLWKTTLVIDELAKKVEKAS